MLYIIVKSKVLIKKSLRELLPTDILLFVGTDNECRVYLTKILLGKI